MIVEPRQRILLVEDSPTQALRLSEAMEEQGWEVEVVDTADAALATVPQMMPDLVIADMNLPGMQGDELCRRIRMNVQARTIPILMLTADDTPAGQLHGLESGADDYVTKSESDELLFLRIRGLLRKSRIHRYISDLGTEGSFRAARLLAIDDSPTYLEYLCGELESEGYVVTRARSGAEGVQLFSEETFDCILVDLVMPDLDGVTVCKKIHERRVSLKEPVVILMLTAQDNQSDMTRGLEAGADDFVGKGTDISVLKARIRALLRRKFFQEENERIMSELAQREMDSVRERTAREYAESRAELAEELEETNSKLRAMQTQLVHTEKMAALGQLTAGIAHEINNPLSFVLNSLYSTRARVTKMLALGDRLDPAARELCDKILPRLDDADAGVERVRELVAKLRTFSRLDEGKFKDIDVAESIDSALQFLGSRIPEGVEVVRDLAYDEPLPCYAGEFNQLVLALVSNALDAVGDSGTVWVRTKAEGAEFVLHVVDTGPGVPDDIKERVFDPFFTTKDVGSGTGLGLSIAHQVAKMHRGSLEVRDAETGGAAFELRLPGDLAGPEHEQLRGKG